MSSDQTTSRCFARGGRLLTILMLVLFGVAGAPHLSSQAAGFYGAEGKVLMGISVDRGDEVYDPDIFVVRPDGSGVKNLTDSAFGQGEAVWSPDGAHIAYSTHSGLSIMRSDGRAPHQIVSFRPGDPYYKYPRWPAWSPDGTRLVYVENLWDGERSETGGSSLVVISPDGERLRRLARFDEMVFSPRWSPDGRHISFWMCDLTKVAVTWVGECSVHVMGADGERIRKLGSDLNPSDSFPIWTIDGRLVFVSGRDCTPPFEFSCRALYRMEADGSELERLAPAQDWTGDGRIDSYLRVTTSPHSSSRLLVSLNVGDSYDNELWLWDLETDRRRKIYAGRLTNSLDWQPRCTVRGTSGDDTLRGTSDRDLICGFGGDDLIRGLGGDDVIFGHGGNDRLMGGSGRDIVVGNAGRDRCDRDERDYSRVC